MRMGNKSLKREGALFFIALWTALTIKYFFFTSAEMVSALSGAYSMVTGSVMMFSATMMGMHSVLNRMVPYTNPGPHTVQDDQPEQPNDAVLFRSLPQPDDKKAPKRKVKR